MKDVASLPLRVPRCACGGFLSSLVAAASAYIARVSPPAFDAPDPQAERGRVLMAGERVTDMSITAQPRSVSREPLFAPISSSGWVNVGGRRY